MLRNKRGMSLTMAVVTIVILFVIMGTLIYSASDSVKIRKLNKLYTDIRQLEDAVSVYYADNKKLPTEGGIYTLDFNENSNVTSALVGVVGGKSSVSSVNDFVNPNDYNTATGKAEYQVINKKLLKNITLDNSGEFIINLKSHTIFLEDGLTIDGKTYYTIPRKYTNLNLNH